MKGSKAQIVCSDADWGKTRLTQPDSTRLLSPSLEERVIFCSLYQPPLVPITPPTLQFCVSCFTHTQFFSLLFCHLFPAYKSCLCLLLITFRHFCPLQLHLPTPVPLCLRLSLLPARWAREGHLCVRDGGRGWCRYIQLLLWITGRGWMDGWMIKAEAEKTEVVGNFPQPSSACWWRESVQRFACSLPHVKPYTHLFCHSFSLAIHHDAHPFKLF